MTWSLDDGPHVARPVGRQQQGGDEQAQHEAAVAERRASTGQRPRDGDDDRHHDGGAEDPPADQLERVEAGELLPVDRQQAPQDVGGDGGRARRVRGLVAARRDDATGLPAARPSGASGGP